MTTDQTTPPFPGLADLGGDYTLCIDIDIDRQDDRRGADGTWVPDQREPFIASYELAAGRMAGRWFLTVSPTSTDQHGGVQTAGPPVVDLRDQAGYPDPLTFLRALLSGGQA